MGKKRRVFSDTERESVLRMLRERASINLIREKVNCGTNVIKDVIKEHNITYTSKQSRANDLSSSILQYFKSDSTVSNEVVKRLIKKHNIIPYAYCWNCGLEKWLDEEINLELDHINGDNRDNRIENLRFLCPNCHSQTNNFRGRNISKIDDTVTDEQLIKALKTTKNIRQALLSVGLTPKGDNYRRCYQLKHRI